MAMKPCISEATTMSSTFAEDVAAFANSGCMGMEVWLTKLETHLTMESPDATRALLGDRNMKIAAAAYQGGLLLSRGEQRKAHQDHFRRRLELCQALAIPTLIVAADFSEPASGNALAHAVDSLAQAGQWAAAFSVRLALEFRAKNSFCSSLDTAAALVSQCGEANVGVNLDIFHYYTGPSKLEDLDLLTPQTLAHVQICDLAGVPRELAEDRDRVLPGDGDFHLKPILEKLRALGYDGWVSLELMNPTLWQVDATQVAEIGYTALRKVLGLTG
jgi:2-keto-myo-inositol isomerase